MPGERLTFDGVLREWPGDHWKPSRTTLQRWLNRAVELKLADRFGLGRSRRPYRYALPGRKFDPTAPLDCAALNQECDQVMRDRFG